MANLFSVGIEIQSSAAEAALGRVNRAFDQTATGAEKALSSVAKMGDGAGKAASGFNLLQQNSLVLVGALTAVSGAMVAVGKASFDIAQANNQAIRANSTLIDNAQELSKSFQQISKDLEYQTNTIELNKASYDVLSSGFTNVADVSKIMKAGVQGAIGGMSDLATITDATTGVLNAYGMSADKAAKVVDQMIVTQNQGKITAGQYGQQIGKVAAIANIAGVSLSEVNTVIAQATVGNVRVESAFSGLAQSISSIIKPSEEARKVAKELGIEFDATALKNKGLGGVFQDVAQKAGGNTEAIAKLFGSIEAFAAIAPSLNNMKQFNEFLGQQENASGEAEKAAKKMLTATQQFGNIAQEVGNEIGQTLVPWVEKAAEAGIKLMKAFLALPDPVKKAAIAIGVGTAALAALAVGVAGLSAIGALPMLIGGVGIAAGAIVSPIGLAVIAVGSLATGFLMASKYADQLKKSSDNLKNIQINPPTDQEILQEKVKRGIIDPNSFPKTNSPLAGKRIISSDGILQVPGLPKSIKPGKLPPPPPGIGKISGPYRQQAIQAAVKEGVDPYLYLGLIEQESNWNPKITSKAGAGGLTQVMPDTARGMGYSAADRYDPIKSLEMGAKYLSQMLKKFDGSVPLALAAYNAGPGAVQKFGGVPPYKETQDYVRKVEANADKYKKIFPDVQGFADISSANRDYRKGQKSDFDLANYAGDSYRMLTNKPIPSLMDAARMGIDASDLDNEKKRKDLEEEKVKSQKQWQEDKAKAAQEEYNAYAQHIKNYDTAIKSIQSQTEELNYQASLVGSTNTAWAERNKLIADLNKNMELSTTEQEYAIAAIDARYQATVALQEKERKFAELSEANTKAADAYLSKLNESVSSLGQLSAEQEKAIGYANKFGDAFDQALSGIVTGSGRAQDALINMLRSIANELASDALAPIKGFLKNGLANLIGGAFGGGGGGFSFGANTFGGGSFLDPSMLAGATFAGLTPLPGLAEGGSFLDPLMLSGGFNAASSFTLPGLAEGGLITKPTFVAAGEKGAEAIIPLDRLGGIAGGGQPINTTINVTVNSDGSAKVDQSGGSNLGQQIEQAVIAVIMKQQRPGGMLYSPS